MNAPNPEQQRAVEARGLVFVSAGAGTGKTTVLVERFARAVCDAGVDVDSILVITYTRARGRRAAQPDPRRAASSAGGPTLHASSTVRGSRRSTASVTGCCSSHPFAAASTRASACSTTARARVLRGEAFAEALTAFCADDDPERLRLLATYGADGLRRMLTGVYETLRSAGRELVLELGERPSLVARSPSFARRPAASPTTRTRRRAARDGPAGRRVLDADARADRIFDLADLRARGERAASYEEARKRVEQAALDELAAPDRDLLQELLDGFAAAYQEGEGPRVRARLRGSAAARARPPARRRGDPRARAAALPVDHGRRVPGHEPAPVRADRPALRRAGDHELFFVGDEFQSIYGFRHADVEVFRERRAQAGRRAAADA